VIKYPEAIRTMIYTTNAVEALHRQFRKVTKSKSIFPNDKSLKKMLYLTYHDISQKWKLPVKSLSTARQAGPLLLAIFPLSLINNFKSFYN
jgi:transposase-like protein